MTILYGNRTLRIRKNLILFFIYFFIWSFQNHIPLKHSSQTIDLPRQRFGTVYHHIKLHTSQTPRVPISTGRLWDHIKLHISQTRRRAGNPAVRFTTICLSNMPLNFLSSFEACLPYKITHLSNWVWFPMHKIRACLPYKITHLSNLRRYSNKEEAACLPYKITHLSNVSRRGYA